MSTLVAPRPAGMLRVVEREVAVFRRQWVGSALSATFNPLFFLLAFGVGLGGLIDDGGTTAAGVSYLEFLAPGLLAASVFQNAAGGSLWPVMAGTIWLRTFHGMAASPITPGEVYGGFLLYTGVFRGLVTAGPFMLIGWWLGAFASPWAVLAVPAALLGGLAAAAPLMAYAGLQTLDSRFVLINRLGIMPLYLFSGTFFPVEQLPDALEVLAVLSPLWHASELARSATLGLPLDLGTVAHVAVLLVWVAVGATWGVRAFTRTLAP